MLSESSSSSSGNLRRGAACQHCRKRKLKCTGDKPSCAMCLKHSKECLYEESYRPKTRLSKLEEKISQLENSLTYSGISKAGRARPLHSSQRKKISDKIPFPASEEARLTILKDTAGPIQQVKFNDQRAHPPAPKNSRDSNFIHVANDFSSIIEQLPVSIQMSPAEMPKCVIGADRPSPKIQEQLLVESTEPRFDDWVYDFNPYAESSLPCTPIRVGPTELEFSSSLHINTELCLQPAATQLLPTPEESPSSLSPFAPLEDRAATLKAAVVEREELPKEVRNSLLSLFFLKKDMFAFSLNLERFWSSLEQETSEDQPHPAFLFAMYHCASVFSPDVAVQALDDVFFDIAKRKLDEAFRDWDCRTIDLIRAAIILSFTSYARARLWFAWVFSGMAMRLCSFARLQRISFPFSITAIGDPKDEAHDQIKGPFKFERKRMRPPKDSIELGEYIHVFWMACTTDKAASTSNGCAPTMHWSEIETPFPLPLELYADIDLVNGMPRTAVYDLFDNSQEIIAGNISASCHYIASLFLSEASRLRDEFIQPSVRNSYLSRRMSSSSNPFVTPFLMNGFSEGDPNESAGLSRTGRVPDEVIQLQNAVLRFSKSLPANRSNPTRRILGGVPSWKSDLALECGSITGTMNELSGQTWGVDPETILIHTEIHTALALIFQERSKFEPEVWAHAVSSARSVVKILLIIADVDFSQVCIIMTICWRITAQILSAEVERRRSAGEEEGLSLFVRLEFKRLALETFTELDDAVWTRPDLYTEARTLTADVELLLLTLDRVGQVFMGE